MSIAINPMPAASSLEDAAAPSAVTPDGDSFLPFAAILDEQSSANQDADDVREVDTPLDVFDAAVRASQAPVDSLAALLAASIPSARSSLRKDEIDQSATAHESIKKDNRPVDATVLLLQAAQNSATQLDVWSAPSVPAPSTVPALSTSDVKDADDVGDASAPVDVFDTAVPASQPPVYSLAASLTTSIPGTRPLLRKDEIDQSTTTQASNQKDKLAVDPTALSLQTVQSAGTQLRTSPGASTSGGKEAQDVGEADVPVNVFDTAVPASPAPVDSLAALLTASSSSARPLLDVSSAPSVPAPSQSDVKDVADVVDADAPLDVFEAPVDSVTASLTASIPGPRPLLRKDEIDQSTTTPGSIKKDKPAVDPTALLLQTVQNAVRQLDTLPAPSAPTPSTSNVKNPVATDEPTRPASNDELVPHLFTALTETDARAVLNANSDDAPLRTAATPLTDLLIKASEQNPQADPLRMPDLPLPRTPTIVPGGGAMVDAIRLAIAQGPQVDQDRVFAQSSIAGFDRRATKTVVGPAIHLTETGSVDAAVRPLVPSSVPAVTLPNEDGVTSSIVQSMRLQMRDGVGTAVVHLEPEYLGAVSISLRVENGVVTASLHAENPQVRAWMEANTPLLRESLAGQGLSLDRLLVTDERIVDDQSQGRRQRQQQEQQAQQRPRRNGAATFEVVV